jgi:hypothetical protein
LLQPLAIGNIAKNFRNADDMAICILDRGHGEINVNGPPIFGESNCFEMLDGSVGTDAFEDDVFVRVQMLGNELEDGSPNHFLGGITEDPGGSIVPTGDDSIKVFADDYVL